VNAGLYWTGISTQLANGSWSAASLTQWTMPDNTKLISPTFGGATSVVFGPDGRAYNGVSLVNTSGSVKVISTSAALHDTSVVNVDLSGEVWQ
jgi:hypothetical protein